jgi:hypothetical protein
MKYNKSKIFKMAWEKVRILKCSLSEALKEAWSIAKKATKIAKTSLEDTYRDIARKYTKFDYPLHQVAIAQKVMFYLS